MAPGRAKGAARTRSAAADQSTISFGQRSKITKPSATPATSKKLKDLDAADHVSEPQTPDSTEPSLTELSIREQGNEEVKQPKDAVELEAEQITDAQLRRYWAARQAERKFPRIHQRELSMNEKILRHFDLSSQYGPCIGIARTKRWKRANNLDLNPPIEVLAVLLQEEEMENTKTERAYVDELMRSRFISDH